VKTLTRVDVANCVIAVLLTAPLLWPLLSGRQIFLRDVGTTHRPAWNAFETIGWARVNPAASFGQPFRANPNLLISYPFPKGARMVEIHAIAHVGLLALGFFLWWRRELSPPAAFVGSLAFTLSGYVVSTITSVNSLTTVAWLPWVMLAAVRRTTRVGNLIDVAILAIFSLSGEPVLVAAGLLLAAALAWRSGTLSRLWITAALALALTAPLHWETLQIARESSRVIEGFGAEQALGYSFHPARLLETLIPGVFGSPSSMTSGGWWGYAVSGDARPYVYSTAVGVIPAMLAVLFGVSTRFRRHRGWWLLLIISLGISMAGYVPGANALWEALSFLHFLRFPIKAFLLTTLAVAVLAAYGFEEGLRNPERFRRFLPWIAIASMGFVAAASQSTRLMAWLVTKWWDRTSLSDPAVVLAPIGNGLAARMLGVALLLGVLLLWTSRPTRFIVQYLLLAAIVIELTIAGRDVMPTAVLSSTASPIVRAARALPGRVYERAGKDLDAVRYGTAGRYPNDEAASLALAQAHQGWALYGAMQGLRYAYDRTPDGSYTWRDHRVQEYLDGAPWHERVKWLRSVGVGAILASDLPAVYPGLRTVLRDNAVGVAVTLYAIESPLPELRAPKRVRWVKSPEEAIALMQRMDFDEAAEVTLEGQGATASAQPTIVVEPRAHEADRVVFVSRAAQPGFVFLARTYTRHVRASAGKSALRVVPANAHLCGVEVPAGDHVVTVDF